MSDKHEPVSPANINYIAWTVADGTATPLDARRLLVEFVRQARESSERIDHRLIEHLADCIGAFLDGRKVLEPAPIVGRNDRRAIRVTSLDKAFGLVRATVGPQPVDGDTLGEVAAQVLRDMLRGKSLERAAQNVARERKAAGLKVTSESQIRDTWAQHKLDGWLMLRLMRIASVEPGGWWTDDELRRLEEIFWDVPGYVRPGEKAFEGRNAIPDLAPRESDEGTD